MSIIPTDIRNEIVERLKQIESVEDVRIILAVESGSRAWGFASTDSDYDVRFLYVRPADWYCSVDLEFRRDVLEYPINDLLDISGWDIRKGLQLLRKSNPPLLEWLSSPIIYQEQEEITARLRELVNQFYDRRSSAYHYLHMAEKNYREYLRRDLVPAKKYFYVLRPIFAHQWIERESTPIPMEFSILLNRLLKSGPVRSEIDTLLERKMSGEELALEERIDLLNDYIEHELERIQEFNRKLIESEKPSVDPLNDFFRWVVRFNW